MTDPAAIMASLVDVRNIAAHKCIRLELHVPAEQAALVIQAFGWPTAVDPVPVAIARIDPKSITIDPEKMVGLGEFAHGRRLLDSPEPPKEHKRFDMLPLSQQAGIRCGDPAFWRYLNEEHFGDGGVEDAEAAAIAVRGLCGVTSRADLKSNTDAGVAWARLNRDFEVWMLG